MRSVAKNVLDSAESSPLRALGDATFGTRDFTNLYTRHFAELVRQAKRQLGDYNLAEDVVHEAFLYLMLGLSEVQTDLDALRILKWKTKNLCIDALRAKSGKHLVALEDQAELKDDAPELSDRLEQASDAALVNLALGKLNERHRAILIENVYKERSFAEIAKESGLTENTVRQLLHRAKKAFRVALVGEAETAGLSISEVLSIAVKKAGKDVGKATSIVASIIVLLMVALGGLPFITKNSKPATVTDIESVTPSTPQTPVTPAKPVVTTKVTKSFTGNTTSVSPKTTSNPIRIASLTEDVNVILTPGTKTSYEVVADGSLNTFIKFDYKDGVVTNFSFTREESGQTVRYLSSLLQVGEGSNGSEIDLRGFASAAIDEDGNVIQGELAKDGVFKILFQLPTPQSQVASAKLIFG